MDKCLLHHRSSVCVNDDDARRGMIEDLKLTPTLGLSVRKAAGERFKLDESNFCIPGGRWLPDDQGATAVGYGGA